MPGEHFSDEPLPRKELCTLYNYLKIDQKNMSHFHCQTVSSKYIEIRLASLAEKFGCSF